MDSYLDMLFPRLRIMKMLLADSGCIFVHLDCHMSHYVKVLMDEIFGHENFRNEIIWHYRTYQGNVSKHFPKKHDTILFYSKSNKYFFRLLKEKDFTKNIDYVRWKKYLVNECEIRGDNYPGTDSRFDVFLKKWKKEHGNMLPSKNDVIYRLEGFTVDSVWDIKNVDPKSSNRFYITQKPEEIAVRIIESATQECDIVADFFAGSGTTLAAAEKMQRRWIGCEAGEIGIRTAMKRLIPIIRRPFVLEKMKI
jgi:site-specific DNA-methyltransferase (adenine-specific)/adenine-specific DNA-methyltransferase